ncbi:MAG TPA: chromosome segregation protein SMC, partial [Tissierellaceae bacterium]|nr:chromosome segregation protein SMC [Tissierellaceae bacterium]
MRLKKLEIQGFKSFAYKTEIKIKDGITAIVGPNGSGKSNISDAVRWVLGEQSVKNLRGSKMEDVIFAGTSKKRPLGYCEVTITFDNTSGTIPLEYSEIAVSRRMFRSGESEYYLNKNSCRLKDIRELFMDTGIGKDGYSIIGQGRIDEVLSDRPEDRRSIFEEAAGIVKYKSKKTQAERKLEKTEDNIIRIKDLIFELSSQEEVLEIQANKASEFNKLHNKLKGLEINLFIIDIRKLNKEIEEINKEKRALEEYLENEISKRHEAEENFNKIKLNIEELEKDIEVFRNKNIKVKEKVDKNYNELTILKEKESFYNKDLDRLIKEDKTLNDKLKELKQNTYEVDIKKKIMEEDYNKLFGNYKEDKEKLDNHNFIFKNSEKEIEKEKNHVIKIYNNSSDIKSQLNSIISFNENIDKRIKQLNKEIDHYKEKMDLLSYENKEETINKEKLRRDLILLNKEFKNKEITLLSNNKKLTSVIESINNNNNQIGSKLSSLNLLENMEEDYEGYYKGVKSILISSKKDKKIRDSLMGVVAELLTVDPKYEKAIEIALGSNSQNIVTPTEQDAKILIEHLKNNKLGRITCLPNDIIKANTINLKESDKKKFNILGLGYELIKFDLKYENIFKYLLGRAIIVKDIDSAIKFANKYNHRYRIITLDGEVLNPGGSLSGGSIYKNKVSIINRKNRIHELKNDVNTFKSIETRLDNEKNIYENEKINLEKETKKLEKQIKEKEYSIIISDNNNERLLNEIFMLKEIIKKTEEEIIELEGEKNNYYIKVEGLKDQLVNFEKDIEMQREKIQNLTLNNDNKKLEIENELKDLTDTKIKINEIENSIKNL